MNDNSNGSRRRDRNRRNRGKVPGAAKMEQPQSKELSTKSPAVKQQDVAKQKDVRKDRRPENRSDQIFQPLAKIPTLHCARCGEPIQDLTSALTDKDGASPVHFDCVITFLQNAENIGENEKVVYIGQGRFAVMFFENPSDTRKFKIIRTIDWESKETKAQWRTDIAGRFTHLK